MKLSLSTHLFAFVGIDDAVAALFRRHGYSRAEIWGMPPHFPHADPAASDAAASCLESHGVSIASVHAPLYPDVRTYKTDRWYSLSSEDDALRAASVAATASAASWLARHEGGVVVVHTSFPAERWYPRRWAAFLSSMNELLYVVPENVRFAIENMPSPSGTPSLVLEIAERYPAERVGVCLDLGHAHISGSVVDAIGILSPRLIHVHASDNNGMRDEHLVPGRGTIPWERVTGALAESGFSGAFTLELHDSTRGESPSHCSFDAILADTEKFLSGPGKELAR